jgi:hypothetical protein
VVSRPRQRGAGAPHDIAWLPETPVVNQRRLELYLWTPLATDQIEAWGLPCADLFLLAAQDGLRLAERRDDGYLLRVQAPEKTAVDLVEHLGDAPASLRARVTASGSTHLLPLAWLSELQVNARFDLDGRGGITARTDLDPTALAVRFEGAGHGLPGLPNEVVSWPDKAAPSYLLVADGPNPDKPRGDFVALSRRKPELVDGHRLYEVKVRRRRAIDIPATLDQLGGLPVVGRMHDFVGLDLLVPIEDLGEVAVARMWRPGPTGKPVVERLTGATLADTLAA